MITKILYRYSKDNAIIDSQILPEGQIEYIERLRLIADEDKVLTKDGEKIYAVIDINKDESLRWYEVDKPENFGNWEPSQLETAE